MHKNKNNTHTYTQHHNFENSEAHVAGHQTTLLKANNRLDS